MESLKVMQLRDFAAFFQPEELAALGAAYDAAWKDLRTSRLSLTAGCRLQRTRDVDQLKEIALRGVSRGQHARPNRRAIARAGKRLYETIG